MLEVFLPGQTDPECLALLSPFLGRTQQLSVAQQASSTTKMRPCVWPCVRSCVWSCVAPSTVFWRSPKPAFVGTLGGESSLYIISGRSRSPLIRYKHLHIHFPICLVTHARSSVSSDRPRQLATAYSHNKSQQLPTTGETSSRSCCSLHLLQSHFVF